uniref:Uncharacterized protein n=1 Tax=Avena sativa TaxID=4498 RepID=A0ACD5VD26_AVESA
MEPSAPTATSSYPVAREPPPRPPPQTAQLGQGPAQPRWKSWALGAFLTVLLTGGFAWGVYRARHSPRNLAFVITTYYLLAVLYCCLAKLDVLRRDDPARRRVRLAVWAVSVALATTIAWRFADSMPYLGLKIAVWVITAVAVGLAFYHFFGRGADGAGTRPEVALHEVSPEQRV